MVSLAQLNALMDFLEVHQECALGRCTRTKEGRSLMKRLWQDCAITLNSVSPDGPQKTPEQWRVYYNEYKSKLIRKIKAVKGEFVATGGGPPKKIYLSPLQERLLNILGQDMGEPLPGVRHNPLQQIESVHQPSTSRGIAGTDANVLEQYEIVWNEANDQQPEPMGHTAEQPEPMAHTAEQPEPMGHTAEQPGPMGHTAEQPGPMGHTAEQPGPMGHTAEQPDPTAFTHLQPEPSDQQPTPRRRRRQRPRSSHPVIEPGINEATARLENMERMSADATREHTAATNRLAAAIEAMVERLREPIFIVVPSPPQARRRYRRMNNIFRH